MKLKVINTEKRKMKLKLKLKLTERRFNVQVLDNEDKVLHETTWKGDEYFEIGDECYSLVGPYHGTKDDRFKLFKLVEIASI